MGTLGVKATIGLDNEARQRAVAPASTLLTPKQGLERGRSWAGKLAYGGLLLFVIMYYARPYDWHLFAARVPLGKITAFLALAGFALVLLERGGVLGLPKEMIVLVLLFGHLCLTIPFASWRGGSFEVVVTEFSKVVVIAVSLPIVVTTKARLRKLLFVQAAAVTVMAMLAATSRSVLPSAIGNRTMGLLGGTFENPNDFAFSIALAFPLCFAFMLRTSRQLRKAFWAVGLVLMAYTVMATYSRAGLIALVVGAGATLWEFGVKGQRHHLILLAALAGILLLFAGHPANYSDRVKTILDPDLDPTGSAQARRDAFYLSIETTLEHPLLGVGPGNFEVTSGTWRETHDTYSQLSSEGGIPALLLFLIILRLAFSKVRLAQRMVPGQSELGLLASALRASLTSFAVGALFSSVAYQFFPYFLIGFASAAYQIALLEQQDQSPPTVAQGGKL